MNLLKTYLDSNRKNLLIYVGMCLLFYILNFAFFRNSIDAPIDLIFAIIFTVAAPGLIVFLILLTNDSITKNNKYEFIAINLMFPFLISFVFLMIYWVIEMQNDATFGQILFVSGAAFPLMILAVIMILLFRHYSVALIKFLVIAVLIFVVYYFVSSGFSIIEKQIENSLYTIIGNIVLFIVIPFGYMIELIRRLDKKLV